jgi:hypothetical protein
MAKRQSIPASTVILRVGLAGLVIIGGLAAAWFAALLDWGNCPGGVAREPCLRPRLSDLQLGMAVAGLLPAAASAIAIVLRRRMLTLVTLTATAAVYLAWAVLADASHHGWDDMKFFGFLPV